MFLLLLDVLAVRAHVLGFPLPSSDALCRLSAILFAKYFLWRAIASGATGVTGDQRADLPGLSDSSSAVVPDEGPLAGVNLDEPGVTGDHTVFSFVTARRRLSAIL